MNFAIFHVFMLGNFEAVNDDAVILPNPQFLLDVQAIIDSAAIVNYEVKK